MHIAFRNKLGRSFTGNSELPEETDRYIKMTNNTAAGRAAQRFLIPTQNPPDFSLKLVIRIANTRDFWDEMLQLQYLRRYQNNLKKPVVLLELSDRIPMPVRHARITPLPSLSWNRISNKQIAFFKLIKIFQASKSINHWGRHWQSRRELSWAA